MVEDEDLNRAVSLSTGTPVRVKKRFKEIQELVEKIV